MEPRFGHDFSGVRVHTDLVASRSADTVAAQAYTVGADIVFGAGRYAPASRDGQRLLAHELAHVQQQQSGPALQRQPLLGEPEQAIPTELRSSANVGQMTDEELADRHDQILEVLGQFAMSTPETALLEREAARIGVELARRKALAEGRTFGEDSIKKMKDYFVKNSQKPAKPPKNPPPAPPGGVAGLVHRLSQQGHEDRHGQAGPAHHVRNDREDDGKNRSERAQRRGAGGMVLRQRREDNQGRCTPGEASGKHLGHGDVARRRAGACSP
jgi:hypothetical protein